MLFPKHAITGVKGHRPELLRYRLIYAFEPLLSLFENEMLKLKTLISFFCVYFALSFQVVLTVDSLRSIPGNVHWSLKP